MARYIGSEAGANEALADSAERRAADLKKLTEGQRQRWTGLKPVRVTRPRKIFKGLKKAICRTLRISEVCFRRAKAIFLKLFIAPHRIHKVPPCPWP